MVKNRMGDKRERELVRRFSGEGDKSPFDYGEWAPMRAPSSGAATERELPDVLVGNGDRVYAIEAKASSGDPIYILKREVEALQFFATNFGAKARIGARFNYHEWRFFEPDELYHTDSGNVRVKEEDLPDGETLAEL